MGSASGQRQRTRQGRDKSVSASGLRSINDERASLQPGSAPGEEKSTGKQDWTGYDVLPDPKNWGSDAFKVVFFLAFSRARANRSALQEGGKLVPGLMRECRRLAASCGRGRRVPELSLASGCWGPRGPGSAAHVRAKRLACRRSGLDASDWPVYSSYTLKRCSVPISGAFGPVPRDLSRHRTDCA